MRRRVPTTPERNANACDEADRVLNKVADALADRSLYCHRILVQPCQHAATGALDVVVSDVLPQRSLQVGKPQFVGLACSCASIRLKNHSTLSGAELSRRSEMTNTHTHTNTL
jgi:hypothetical protein